MVCFNKVKLPDEESILPARQFLPPRGHYFHSSIPRAALKSLTAMRVMRSFDCLLSETAASPFQVKLRMAGPASAGVALQTPAPRGGRTYHGKQVCPAKILTYMPSRNDGFLPDGGWLDRALRILQDLGHSDERHGSGSFFLSTCGDPEHATANGCAFALCCHSSVVTWESRRQLDAAWPRLT